MAGASRQSYRDERGTSIVPASPPDPESTSGWTRAARVTSSQQTLQRLRVRQGGNGWAGGRSGASGC